MAVDTYEAIADILVRYSFYLALSAQLMIRVVDGEELSGERCVHHPHNKHMVQLHYLLSSLRRSRGILLHFLMLDLIALLGHFTRQLGS